MIESGELHKIQLRHKVREPDCDNSGKGKPIGFENISLIFLILLAGLVLSGFLCFLEVQMSKHPKSMKSAIALTVITAVLLTLYSISPAMSNYLDLML